MNTIKIKTRALLYVGIVHVGMAVALVALFREDGGASMGSTSFGLLLAGIGLMYGAFLFSVVAFWIPIRPWLRRYDRAKAWRMWAFDELPTILALIPVIISALKILKAAWSEIRGFHELGELNVGNLVAVAQKFAAEAEVLAREPGVERVRKKIKDLA